MSGHILSRVCARNFRSIKEETITLSAFTPLVGRNNAGKSNILAAVRWLLRKALLTAGDYGDVNVEIVVEGTVSGIGPEVLDLLDPQHAKKVSPFLKDNALELRRIQPSGAGATKDLSLELRNPADGEWVKNPTGLDQAIQALFPEPIVIAAMENAAEDVAKFGKTTSIGRLLTEIIEPIREKHAENIRTALSAVSQAFSADSTEKDQALLDIDTRLKSEVEKFFPGLSPKTHIPTPGLDDFLRAGTIKVFEDGAEIGGRDAANMGHGAQRSIQMGLVTCLSEVRREKAMATPTTTLLMLDEPELYLHPQAVELVRSALHSLSERGYQVLFSTHSPSMILRQDAPNVVLVRKTAEKGTHTRKRLRDAVAAAIADAPSQTEILFSLTNSQHLLFTDRVLLIEGATERRVLPDLFRVVMNKTMGEHQIGLIPVEGSGGMLKSRAVLAAMNIPAAAVVDLDFAFKNGESAGIEPDCAEMKACLACFQKLAVAEKVALGTDGLPTKSEKFGKASVGFELMAGQEEVRDALHSIHMRLREQGFWLWKLGAIEKHIGIPGKTQGDHAAFVEQLVAKGDCEGLPDVDGLRDFCSWIVTTSA